jgi:hypothetical protein
MSYICPPCLAWFGSVDPTRLAFTASRSIFFCLDC